MCFAFGVVPQGTLFSQADAGESTTLIVVRHAEREGNLDKLTATGKERAQLLRTIGQALNVQAIYSTDTERTKGTVKPLADALEIPIQSYRRLSKRWIVSLKEKHAEQVVMIVGHSNTTGVIAGGLANREPFEIDHDEYDALFIVQVSRSDAQCLRLRYGPSSEGAASADADKMGVTTKDAEAK
ncbi:MAG: histidine phosphatase family protein [Planctomycetota bacterium]